jgi:phospholipid/cholesterol/gamma-HCH transport system permease protein
MKLFYHFGKYLLLLSSLFVRPEKTAIYWRETSRQMVDIGVGSLGIIAVISIFVGAVITVQMAFQLVSGFIPDYVIGTIVRDTVILELAPTITCLVLAGKIGSNIASELGTMRISEQIDALEIMGVSTPAYLIGPKILAGITTIPCLILIAVVLAIGGGMTAGLAGDILSQEEYIRGLRDEFDPYIVQVMIMKSFIFAFIITSTASYQGYTVQGGALEIGKASTRAVVYSCIMILVADYLVAELML